MLAAGRLPGRSREHRRLGERPRRRPGDAPGAARLGRRRVRPGRDVWCVRQGTFSISVASGSSPRPGTNEFRSGLVDW